MLVNPIALRMAKTPLSFGRSESNSVNVAMVIMMCYIYIFSGSTPQTKKRSLWLYSAQLRMMVSISYF